MYDHRRPGRITAKTTWRYQSHNRKIVALKTASVSSCAFVDDAFQVQGSGQLNPHLQAIGEQSANVKPSIQRVSVAGSQAIDDHRTLQESRYRRAQEWLAQRESIDLDSRPHKPCNAASQCCQEDGNGVSQHRRNGLRLFSVPLRSSTLPTDHIRQGGTHCATL